MAKLDAAEHCARRVAPAWAATTVEERAETVIAAAAQAAVAVESDALARLLTREHGKVYWESVFDTGTIAGMAAAFAPLASAALQARQVGSTTTVEWRPHGVVAAILPFNWPASVMANKVVPALLAGNAVVVKVPPTCPGAVLLMAAAMAEVLPAGVLNVVNGPSAALGAALVAHGGIDMVSFTGGTATGQAVMAAAAATTKPVVLELGGNDAALVAPDVAITDELVEQIASAAFDSSGQICMAIKRLYVHQSKMEEMIDGLAERLSRHVVGDGLADEVTLGPVHTAQARHRVEAFIDEAAMGGGRVVRPARLREADAKSGGYFVTPALVADPPPDCRLVRQEQFAPALPVLPYAELNDAVAAANDTSFGLCASIWTNDDALADDVAERLEAGTVFVNAHGMAAIDMQAPMAGWKQSGFGAELGHEGMQAYARQRVRLRRPGQGREVTQ
jgi:acyl-CoA reductase-like NAD-dependent aldehyde dehydrogenase